MGGFILCCRIVYFTINVRQTFRNWINKSSKTSAVTNRLSCYSCSYSISNISQLRVFLPSFHFQAEELQMCWIFMFTEKCVLNNGVLRFYWGEDQMKDSEGVMVGQHILIKVKKEKKKTPTLSQSQQESKGGEGCHLLFGGHRYGNLFCRLLQSRIC